MAMADDDPKTGDDKPDPKSDPDKGRDDEKDWRADAEKWKALARKHEAEAKKGADAAKRLADLEGANQSELEKATAAKTAAEERAVKAEREALRARIAMKKGLTEAQSKRLMGETEEELEQDADELLATFKPAEQDGKDLPRRPQERLRSGAREDKDPEPDAKTIVDKMMAQSL